MSFKVGDRVKVYDICQITYKSTEDKGIIEEIDNDRLWAKMENWGNPDTTQTLCFHKKQCRKLVKKEIKLPKKLSDDFGFGKGITRERYRQMKLKLKRRWKQVQELEKMLGYCVKEIGQLIELANREDQTKEDVKNWLQYVYDYWKKYE